MRSGMFGPSRLNSVGGKGLDYLIWFGNSPFPKNHFGPFERNEGEEQTNDPDGL